MAAIKKWSHGAPQLLLLYRSVQNTV